MQETFEEWCKNNNREDLLNEWDYELNKILPSEITTGSVIFSNNSRMPTTLINTGFINKNA